MYHKKIHIHFVGIGGIGMSGIAKILLAQGYVISGCDNDTSKSNVEDLRANGCKIYAGNNTPECKDSSIDIVVYSSAIKSNNPEIIAAQQRTIPTIPRALMLAELMRTKFSIAIAGSHGKTTTTSLISHILIEAGIDPTVVIGGVLKNISTNARHGTGEFLVAEADESDRSLIHLQATLAVVTNIDLEHLETYKDLDDIKQTFQQFLNNLPFYGKAIVCIDNPNVQALLPLPHLKTVKYGFTKKHADIYADSVELKPDHSIFNVHTSKTLLGTIFLQMPGKHNILNALAAIAIARELEIPFSTIASALKSFSGIERRFSFNGTKNGIDIFDDYGHHPEEIYHTLQVARPRAQGKLIVAFQPHRYTRTHKLWQKFVDMFARSAIDELIITDIYPASEEPIEGITAQNLVKAIEQQRPPFKVRYIPLDDNFTSLKKCLETITKPTDLLLLQGAGKINQLSQHI